jgi:hypothetical protein
MFNVVLNLFKLLNKQIYVNHVVAGHHVLLYASSDISHETVMGVQCLVIIKHKF